jgi:endoglucanase
MILKLPLKAAAVLLAIFVNASGAPSAVPRRTDSLPVGRCVNMGNHLEAPTEGAWGDRKIADDDFLIIAKAGFNTVRIPVRWAAHAEEKPPFTIDKVFMARVRHVVDNARAARLHVILNSHHYDDIHSDPSDAHIARLAGMWTQIAATFAKAPNETLWFEIENEPHDQFNDGNLLKVLTPALAAIRKSNPKRPVIIGGESWSGITSLKTLKLPDDPNIVPTFHYYDPFEFTHQGADWVNPSPPMGRGYGNAEDQARLRDDVKAVRVYIKRTGKTPFIGEFGANEKVPLDDRVKYQTSVRLAFDQLNIGMCAWSFTNTFPLYDSAKKQWVPGMRGAMGLPEPRLPSRAKKNGRP